MNAFFVLPGSSLLSLREELEILEGEWAGDTLERMGFKAGATLVTSLEIPLPTMDNFAEVFTQLWSESGLSRTKVIRVSPEEIVVTFDESLEAAHGRRCDFTRGYLAGITSTLLGRRYKATEVICMSKGAEKCVHHLTPFEQLYLPPVTEKDGKPKLALEAGCSYLIEAEDANRAFEIFEDYLTHGHPGMCVVREFPDRLRKAFHLDQANMLWLSYESDRGEAREPTNIPMVYAEIKSFLDSQQNAVLLISGLEYMISQNNFNKVLKFAQLVSESAAVSNSIFLLPISTETLSTREVKLLEREFREIVTEEQTPKPKEELKLKV